VTDASLPGTSYSLPQRLAFLELGERLRQRGQFAAAAAVALAGLGHYPAVADAHDLLGRIRADQGDDPAAVAAWRAALECDPAHIGARKGLAFVAFRAHDFGAAERHLELAAMRAPHDATVLAALDRVRALRPSTGSEEPARLIDPLQGTLLYDTQGMRLTGGGTGDEASAADLLAAEGAGLTREATRAARLLALGAVRYVAIESPSATIAMLPVTDDAALILHRPAAIPIGRLLAHGERAMFAARQWLGTMR
jgi:predicted regulator of Ras-like GTPase activity (Roadblock/LC7/MglB family)